MRFDSVCGVLTILHRLSQVRGADDVVFEIDNKRPEGMIMLPTQDTVDVVGLEGDGPFALIGEFWYGGVKAMDLSTGLVTQVVNSSSYGERGSIGLAYYDGVILACSGGDFQGDNNVPALYAYDAATGLELAQCLPDFGGTFMNDVTVLNGTAYATDSFFNQIMVLDVESAKNGECIVSSIETPAEIFLGDTFTTNGILAYNDGLLIVQEVVGGIYWLDLLNNNTVTSVIPDGSVVKADGICMGEDDDILYVAQNYQPGPLTGWELAFDTGTVTASNLGSLESSSYDSPTSCGVAGDMVYAVNMRFSIGLPADGEDDPTSFNETFPMVGVDRMEFSDATPAPPSPSPTPDATGSMTSGGYILCVTNRVIMMSLVTFWSWLAHGSL